MKRSGVVFDSVFAVCVFLFGGPDRDRTDATGVTGRRSTQLNYGAVCGSASGTRTHVAALRGQHLCRLTMAPYLVMREGIEPSNSTLKGW